MKDSTTLDKVKPMVDSINFNGISMVDSLQYYQW